MQRITSGSSIGEGFSSIVTGDSTQIAIEGQWDETVPLQDIHEGIVEHLTRKLEKLKAVYKGLKMNSGRKGRVQGGVLMKKIVQARITYQRYVAATQDILTRCGEFVRRQRDTPETRIAFIRNAQEYFFQARDFVKLDITFRKMSPTLLRYIEPNPTDSPEVYERKRDLCRAVVGVLGRERFPHTMNGPGKVFRTKYIQQGKVFSRGFPTHWIHFFPPVLKDVLWDAVEEKRWPLTIMFLFSRFCSRMYVNQGFCPGCHFPILRDTEDIDASGGKLSCNACRKEIEWTYHVNPRSLRTLFSGFHALEVETMREGIQKRILAEECREEGDETIEDILLVPPPILLHGGQGEDTSDNPTKEPGEDYSPPKKPVSPGAGRGRPRSKSPDGEVPGRVFRIISFREVTDRIREFIKRVYSEDSTKMEQRLKDVYHTYKTEIQAFEGLNEEVRYPRGLISKVDKYVRHYYNTPPREDIQSAPPDEKGGKAGTNRGMVVSALINLNHGNLIDQTSFICEKLWGYSLPNLSEHRDQILYECVLQKEVFIRLSPDIGRKSNLSQQIILMYVCQRHGYRWSEEDFHITFSESTKKKQLSIMEEIFEVIDR